MAADYSVLEKSVTGRTLISARELLLNDRMAARARSDWDADTLLSDALRHLDQTMSIMSVVEHG